MPAYRRVVLLGLLLLGVLPTAAGWAQTEIERERNSLRGIEGFYLSLNVEGNRSVVEQDDLDFDTLHQRLRTRLREAGLPVLAEDGVSPAQRAPYLHLHVNVMEADRGQLPFAIESRFYQAVRLVRDETATVAVTWESSVVGLTYAAQVAFIADAAMELLEDFIEDFQRVNS